MGRIGMKLVSEREAASEKAFHEEVARVEGEWYGHAVRLLEGGADVTMAAGPSGYEILVDSAEVTTVVWSVEVWWRDCGVCVFRTHVPEGPDGT